MSLLASAVGADPVFVQRGTPLRMSSMIQTKNPTATAPHSVAISADSV
jgi:hypothetical protein